MSLIIFSHRQPANDDSFLYLTSAAYYLKGGFTAAYEVYAWPFFPMLIAWVHQLTGFSLITSGQIIITLLNIVIVLHFALLVQVVYKKPHFVWLGILTVLCFSTLNHLRSDILRDQGYWAFSLLAIVCLLKLRQSQQWRYGFAWGLSMSIAALFRIEGAIILLFAPLGLLLRPAAEWKTTLALLIKAYCLVLTAGITLLLYLSQHHGSLHYLGRLMEIKEVFLNAAQTLLFPFKQAVTLMQQYVLSPVAKGSAATLLMGGIINVLCVSVVQSLRVIYTGLIGYSLFYKTLSRENGVYLLYWILILNLLICFFFTLSHLFLVERYVLLLCLIAMLWIPGSLHAIYVNWQQKRTPYGLYPLVCIGFLYLLIGSVWHFGTSKTYLLDGADWLRRHKTENTFIITNNKKICYLGRDQIDDGSHIDCIEENFKELASHRLIKLHLQNSKPQVYIAIDIYHNNREKILIPDDLKNRLPVAHFKNNHNDKLLIFSD